ncbi:uncharacterized protein LOC133849326 isoform X2 [Drosophila sulfurigaster albostrigata]|uniref:uncharacterized protein LOC133849326 isoform X2 n=1 Tax=Drosophila sulfurigaster albostrigata TaxID=89887 RepID=UPI002D21BE64|nr:uncharacterized protein LOC133849326 isoform X2 [Drosophila sulfurigaster albostrigata]
MCLSFGATGSKLRLVCDTRWLSIEMAVTRILDQWHELKTHFGIAAMSEKCKTAKILYESFCDKKNYLYLVFLKPILQDMQKINLCFQSNSANATMLLSDLILAIRSLRQKIIPPDIDVDIINDDDFEKHVKSDLGLGYDFEKEVKSMNIESVEEMEIRECCSGFVVELAKQLKQRLPDNFNILKQIDAFSVENILKIKKKQISPILEYFRTPNIDKIERLYNDITLVEWENVDDTVKFWAEVLKYRDSGGNCRFQELASVALQMQSLPWSNADVERVFSQVNLIKTKIRNSMSVETLNAILSIRYGLRRHNMCCFNYNVPPSCLSTIEDKKFYPIDDDDNIDDILNII